MRHILVVDDEPCIREICAEYLSMAGYQVDTRATGEEALEAASRHRYDLLILDLCMQGISGLTTLKRLKSIAPDAKALVVSGSIDRFEPELEDARRDGLLGVLPKPFGLRDLSVLVESALQGRLEAA